MSHLICLFYANTKQYAELTSCCQYFSERG